MSNPAIERHLVESHRARQLGRADEARRHLQAVLELDPDQPVARNALGMDALTAGDARTAAGHFEAACARDPMAIAPWMNLATARRQLGEDEGERAALETALERDQTQLMALVRLGQLHERLNETWKAVERWSGVSQLSVGYPDAPEELRAIFDHARAFVARHNKGLVDAMEAQLAGSLAQASARDRRRVSAAMNYMTGTRRIFTNQCEGMHYPFLPADEYFDRDHFAWMTELEAATSRVREELLAILAMPSSVLAPYVAMAPGTPENIWTGLNNSLDWSALHLWRDGVRIEQACEIAPRTAELLDAMPLCRIPGRAPTAFFSILKAGKHIPPHTGVTNTRAIIHLGLVVPPDCEFRVGDEQRAWKEGEAFAFDDTIEHEAWNRSDQDRAVLIFDTWNPHLSEAAPALRPRRVPRARS
jgi:aspartyl/asparaginyl beta-hydroxylase (cupin superfamily)/Flp pilus assembly protein TadD